MILEKNIKNAPDLDWHYAFGKPESSAIIKAEPEDFRVTELMEIDPEGEGEHCWLWVNKKQQNTEQVAKQLARLAGVSMRDVSYSGMKDYHAVTSQWFSVWLPGKPDPDWSKIQMEGVSIEKNMRHTRKLKRGFHTGNRFQLVLREISNKELLEQCLLQIESHGVPNYFGEQRFGRNANNINEARSMFESGKYPRNKHKKSLYLSAARSWLFNLVLSERVKQKTWNQLMPGEPVNLDASNSFFVNDEDKSLEKRLLDLDIHPTAPLWGKGHQELVEGMQEIEKKAIADYLDFAEGLIDAGLKHERRATRIKVNNLQWQIENSQCLIEFALNKGQFATSVLRECVSSQ